MKELKGKLTWELLTTEKNLGEDFIYAINVNEVLQEIVSAAQNLNDVADFGTNVAYVLKKHKLIEEPVYDLLTGEI